VKVNIHHYGWLSLLSIEREKINPNPFNHQLVLIIIQDLMLLKDRKGIL
jgi:hypothetical protein